MKPKVLLLSAYDAQSHRHWHQMISNKCSNHYSWHTLTLPARYFNWRIRGNSLSWAWNCKDELSSKYSGLLTTSMTDLSSLRGFIPSLAHIPTIMYFHENQFCYPNSTSSSHHKDQQRIESQRVEPQRIEPKIVTMYSALCADRLLFNSQFNCQSFLQGVEEFLKKMPDHKPADLHSALADKSHIVSVPLLFESSNPRLFSPNSFEPLILLWNHRWEFDKGPEQLYALLKELQRSGIDFKIHIIGQQFRNTPPIFNEISKAFKPQILTWGYQEDTQRYHQLLRESDIVLSTALHDFQGLSILEAVSQGCLPLVPNRLAYPEWFDQKFCYASHLNNLTQEAKSAVNTLKSLINTPCVSPSVDPFLWQNLQQEYQTHFQNVFGQ